MRSFLALGIAIIVVLLPLKGQAANVAQKFPIACTFLVGGPSPEIRQGEEYLESITITRANKTFPLFNATTGTQPVYLSDFIGKDKEAKGYGNPGAIPNVTFNITLRNVEELKKKLTGKGFFVKILYNTNKAITGSDWKTTVKGPYPDPKNEPNGFPLSGETIIYPIPRTSIDDLNSENVDTLWLMKSNRKYMLDRFSRLKFVILTNPNTSQEQTLLHLHVEKFSGRDRP